jgi:hypothetical protein
VVRAALRCLASLLVGCGAPIIQGEWCGGDNQSFRPEPTSDGYYRLVAKHSGKCLDVTGISAANGAAIIQWDWWGGNNQQWRW